MVDQYPEITADKKAKIEVKKLRHKNKMAEIEAERGLRFDMGLYIASTERQISKFESCHPLWVRLKDSIFLKFHNTSPIILTDHEGVDEVESRSLNPGKNGIILRNQSRLALGENHQVTPRKDWGS